ncbi:hypothetical protein MAPG_00992 [Magnaporthiopsis poae ATCC 64411]|uniref:Uncharacterized protein n=1 Tax=Magnaporthiopsis poae (strain ATCC 64411 / 73-15) TaxID=644358 RepID=A0A0C4DMI4_MAGP6|nr:hypothetical protein MAPG_00992 [Magnaporthiopsis poae ATCC 64411]
MACDVPLVSLYWAWPTDLCRLPQTREITSSETFHCGRLHCCRCSRVMPSRSRSTSAALSEPCEPFQNTPPRYSFVVIDRRSHSRLPRSHFPPSLLRQPLHQPNNTKLCQQPLRGWVSMPTRTSLWRSVVPVRPLLHSPGHRLLAGVAGPYVERSTPNETLRPLCCVMFRLRSLPLVWKDIGKVQASHPDQRAKKEEVKAKHRQRRPRNPYRQHLKLILGSSS